MVQGVVERVEEAPALLVGGAAERGGEEVVGVAACGEPGWQTCFMNAHVSDRDKRISARQAAALARLDELDEGTPAWRAGAHEWLDGARAEAGVARLATEGEFHRYAAYLGLLRRDPSPAD